MKVYVSGREIVKELVKKIYGHAVWTERGGVADENS